MIPPVIILCNYTTTEKNGINDLIKYTYDEQEGTPSFKMSINGVQLFMKIRKET